MSPLRYVILRHEGIDPPHFDLMFETAPGSPLATWRGEMWPITTAAPLTRLADHRNAYLSYEGPLSENRGSVRQVESGEFRLLRDGQEWAIAFSDGSELQIRPDLRHGTDAWTAIRSKPGSSAKMND
jgi:hypothetical protein